MRVALPPGWSGPCGCTSLAHRLASRWSCTVCQSLAVIAARVGSHAAHRPRMLNASSVSAFLRQSVSHEAYSGSFLAYAIADMMSVLNHLSLVDCTTVNPSHDRPGAGRGISCPRPQVQFPRESLYATSSSFSAASRSTASRRSIDGSSIVSLVIAMLVPHMVLNIVDSIFDVIQRLLHRCVLLLDGVQLVVVLGDVPLGGCVLILQLGYLVVDLAPVVAGCVEAARCGDNHSDGGDSRLTSPVEHGHL